MIIKRDEHGSRLLHRRLPDQATAATLCELLAVLYRERPNAEATLGRPLVDPYAFAADYIRDGLGHALNGEQDRIDDLDHRLSPSA